MICSCPWGPQRRTGQPTIGALAGCTRDDVVKAMVWLRERADFGGFNSVYADYFPNAPPARSAIVSDLLVDCRVEVEVIAWRPLPDRGGK